MVLAQIRLVIVMGFIAPVRTIDLGLKLDEISSGRRRCEAR